MTLRIPKGRVREYLDWLKNPEGFEFRMDFETVGERIDIRLPFVETREGYFCGKCNSRLSWFRKKGSETENFHCLKCHPETKMHGVPV